MHKSVLVLAPIVLSMGGIQAGLIVSLRILKGRGVNWPMTLMAVLSAALLAAGVLRHYWDIWQHRTVRGISFTFVAIDAAGDLFSLISILFQPRLDIFGMVIYGTELVLWLGVFACGGYYNLVPWWQRMRSGEEDQVRPNQEDTGLRERDGNGTAAAGQITLHDLPSSTSVFRTASVENDLRQRASASTRTA